jgi:hypothetical protein
MELRPNDTRKTRLKTDSEESGTVMVVRSTDNYVIKPLTNSFVVVSSQLDPKPNDDDIFVQVKTKKLLLNSLLKRHSKKKKARVFASVSCDLSGVIL